MAHHKYHTEGFILESRNFGEANRYFTIFTRELGVVRAAAQGVRHLKSKLRYALQDYAYVRADLVRGRDIWRVTSASAESNFSTLLDNSTTARLYIRILALVTRLSQGEEPHPELFSDISTLFSFLEKNSLTADELRDIEIVAVLRVLSHLGYVGDEADHKTFIEEDLSLSLLEGVRERRALLVARINQSIRESQL